MKKIVSFLMLIIITCIITGCDKTEDGNLIITEYVLGDFNAKAIEIFNPLDEDVKMDNYKIAIYKETYLEPRYLIELKGTLKSKESYVVAYDKGPTELLEKADLLSNDLFFTGDDPITLQKKGVNVCQLGTISTLAVTYAVSTALVKIDPYSNLNNSKYVETDWFEYAANDFSYLGTVEHPLTLEDIIKGPSMLDEWFELSFFPEGTTSSTLWSQSGTGGVEEVTVLSYGDGDTTTFSYPQSFLDLGLNNYTNRLRYFGVNTPESGGGTTSIQEFGITAKNYTNNLLKNAEVIHIQSLENYSIDGTFSRLMGLVWVDGVLLQNEIIKMGYSEFTHASIQFLANGIPITSYLNYNAKFAKLEQKGIWGGIDPLWNYETNSPK